MFDIIYTTCFSLLEMIFLFSVLLILHDIRHILGEAGFYIVMGLLFTVMQVLSVLNMNIATELPGLNFRLSSSILFLPFFTMLLVIYYADGIEAAQKLTLALMVALGMYGYLVVMTMIQIRWGESRSILDFLYTDTVREFLRTSLFFMAASVASFAATLFILPAVFQILRNAGCHLFIQVTGTLLATQITHGILFMCIRFWGTTLWWDDLCATYLSRSISLLVLSGLTTIYLTRYTSEALGKGRGPIDIILSFLGAPGRINKLTGYLEETQERYKLLFYGAADMVVFFNEKGKILEINKAGRSMLDLTKEEVDKNSFAELAGLDCETWRNVINRNNKLYQGMRCEVTLPKTGREITLSFSVSRLGGNLIYIAMGRDETENKKIARERNEWQMNLMHRQRVESIGRLAGGIAHDFNNYLHAMQGHLDLIRYMHPIEDKDVVRHLENIDQLTTKASVLTQELLGFARKGNYREQDFDLKEVTRTAAELCRPSARSKSVDIVTVSCEKETGSALITGDPVQFQQVIINLLFNAVYAIEKTGKQEKMFIRITLSRAEDCGSVIKPPGEIRFTSATDYYALRISDTGTGIEESVMPRIFEPFFSTKPVGEGTGMGLSMAYGIISQHKGWIQVENNPDGGASFILFLPMKRQTDGGMA